MRIFVLFLLFKNLVVFIQRASIWF
jgi:hypothetical protein